MAWEAAKAKGIPISFTESSPPVQGQEVVVVLEHGGVVAFDRAIVTETQTSIPLFYRVFYEDRGIYNGFVHVSRMFPIPQNAPRCAPLVGFSCLKGFVT